ncbi:MAG: FkbM family methyltransferase, partial [Actinomycetes bacterium]
MASTDINSEEIHFVSYAQHGEDVVLWRALSGVDQGRYVDVGAADPVEYSVTNAFYQRGWRGIDVEPVNEFAERLRESRPQDTVVECAVSDSTGELKFFVFPETGLSTAEPDEADNARELGYTQIDRSVPMQSLNSILAQYLEPGDPIHFLKVDVEGFEKQVLKGLDLDLWRPWVVVVEATRPNLTEQTFDRWEHLLTDAGYERTLFDGLNAYYVSPNHPELVAALAYPACPLDRYSLSETDERVGRFESQLAREKLESQKWKDQWAQAQKRLIDREGDVQKQRVKTAKLRAAVKESRAENAAIRNSTSWRLTSAVRRLGALGNNKTKRPENSVTSPSRKAESTKALGRNQQQSDTSLAETIRQRLIVVNEVLMLGAEPSTPTMILLELIADKLESTSDKDSLLWLLFIVFHSRYPSAEEAVALGVKFGLDGAAETLSSLASNSSPRGSNWAASAPIRLVSEPMILVTHTSHYDGQTGIQRVARETVSRWVADHALTLAAFDKNAHVYRPLSNVETNRVLRWGSALDTESVDTCDRPSREILIPWCTSVVLPELVGSLDESSALVAIGNSSNSKLSAILFDLIPYTFPEACADSMHAAFARYMRVIRDAKRVSTISESVASDLRGFGQSATNLGVRPPEVKAQLLPVHAHQVSQVEVDRQRPAILGIPGVPLILSVSSIEPRKNHVAILAAAEALWREG